MTKSRFKSLLQQRWKWNRMAVLGLDWRHSAVRLSLLRSWCR